MQKKKVSGSYWSHTSLQFKSPTMSGVVCTNILSCFDYHGGSCECIFARISRLLLCKGHQQEMIGRKHRAPPKKGRKHRPLAKLHFPKIHLLLYHVSHGSVNTVLNSCNFLAKTAAPNKCSILYTLGHEHMLRLDLTCVACIPSI